MLQLAQSCFFEHIIVAGDGLSEPLFQSAERGLIRLGPTGLVHVLLELSVGLFELNVLAEESGVELLIFLLGSLELVFEAVILLMESLYFLLGLLVELCFFAVGLIELLVFLLELAI